jgi:hypothetical protein
MTSISREYGYGKFSEIHESRRFAGPIIYTGALGLTIPDTCELAHTLSAKSCD